MKLNFFRSLAKLFGGRTTNSATYRSALLTYAKTEYRNDWRFAYDYMLTHNGRGPSHTHTRGFEL